MIASLGVVGAAVYALRLFIRAMHNRVGPKVTSCEIKRWEAVAIVPMVLLILVFAFYPQFALKRSQPTVTRHGRRRERPRSAAVVDPPPSTTASSHARP